MLLNKSMGELKYIVMDRCMLLNQKVPQSVSTKLSVREKKTSRTVPFS